MISANNFLPLTTNKTGNYFSYATPKLQRVSEFRYASHTPPTEEWTVWSAVVNKPNTRIAVLPFDNSQEHIDIKDAISIPELFGRTVASSVDKFGPAFNDEGNHLAVVLKNRIESVDPRNGSALDHISIEQPLPNDDEALQITVGIGHSTNMSSFPEQGEMKLIWIELFYLVLLLF